MAKKKTTADKQVEKAIISAAPKNIREVNNLFQTGSTSGKIKEKESVVKAKSLPVRKSSSGDIEIQAPDKVIADFIKSEENKVSAGKKQSTINEYKRTNNREETLVRQKFGSNVINTESAPKPSMPNAFEIASRRFAQKNAPYTNSPYSGKSYAELTNLRKGIERDMHSGKITQAQAEKEKNTIDMWRASAASKEELAQMRKEAEEYKKHYTGVYNDAQMKQTGYSRGMFSAEIKDANEKRLSDAKEKLSNIETLIGQIKSQQSDYEAQESYDENLIKWGKVAIESGASDEYKPTKYGTTEYDLINKLKNGELKNDAPVVESIKNSLFGQMTDGELKLYNTLYNVNVKKADAYLKDIEGVLKRRLSNMQTEEAYEYAQEHPILGGARSVVQNVAMGLPAAVDNVVESITGDIDTYDDTSRILRTSQAAREGGAQYFTERFGETGGLLYNTGVSIVENLANVLLFKGAGKAASALISANMATSAASNAMISAADRGGNERQILMSGVASGLAEYLFEKISIDRLLSPQNTKGIRNFVKNAFIQGGVEGSEETFTEIANIISDSLIMQGQSENARKRREYVMQGMSAEEATKKVMQESVIQVAMAAASGAISGGVMGTGAGVINNMSRSGHMTNVGERLINNPDRLNRILQIGVENGNQEVSAYINADTTHLSARQAGKMTEGIITDALAKKGDIASIIRIIGALEGRDASYLGSKESFDTARAVLHFTNETATKEDTALLERSSGAVTLLTAIEGDTKAWQSVKTAAKADAEYRVSRGFEENIAQIQSADDGVQNDGESNIAGVRYKVSEKNENNISAVTTDEVAEIVKDSNNARKNLIEYAKKIFPKAVVNTDTGNEIGISRNGIDKFLSGNITKEKYATGYKIPELVKYAKKVGEATNKKNTEGIIGYDYYENVIQIDGENYTAHIRVRKTGMGDKYYGHTISQIVDQIKIEPLARSSEETSTVHPVNALGSINSISNSKTTVNSNNMQNSSENTQYKRIGLVMNDAAMELDKETCTVAEKLGQMTKSTVIIQHGLVNKKGKTIMGSEENGVIHINADFKDVAHTIIVHEFTHRMQKLAPKAYKKFRNYVVETLGKDKYDASMEVLREKYSELSDEDLLDELCASTAEKLFQDEAELTRFMRTDFQLVKIVKDVWLKVLELVGKADERARAQELWSRCLAEATKKAKKNDTEKGNPRYLYAGKSAKTAEGSFLRTAKRMKKDGVTKEEILKETGWFEGKDGKWRFEISDRDAIFSRDGGKKTQIPSEKGGDSELITGNLEDFLKHDKLYEAYPDAGKIKVAITEEVPPTHTGAIYGYKLIILSSRRSDENIKKTLIHEVQHWIQRKEGFSHGTSEEYFRLLDNKGWLIEEVKKRRKEIVDSLSDEDLKTYEEYMELTKSYNHGPIIVYADDERTQEEKETLVKAIESIEGMRKNELLKKIRKYDIWLDNPRRMYGELTYEVAGEIEAYDAADRVNMSSQERNSVFPDTGNENTIFIEKIFGKNYKTLFKLLRKKGNQQDLAASNKTPGVSEKLDDLLSDFGTMKKGAEPRRDVSVPKRTEKDNKVRQFARTAAEATTLSEETSDGVLEGVAEGKLSYKPISDKSAMDYAYSTLDAMGFEWVEKKVGGAIANHSFDKNTVALAEVLLQSYDEMGQQEKAQQLIIDFAAEATRMGQSIQAISMLKKLDKNYEVSYIDKIVENLREEILERNAKWYRWKETDVNNIEVSEELKNELREAKTEAEREKIREKIYTELAEKLPVSWVDRWNAWRYFAMLGNFRTHVRNVLGNAFFMPMIATKNITATFAEEIGSVLSKGKMERSKSLIVPKEYREFAKKDALEMKEELSGGGKHNPSDIIRDKQKLFPKGLEWMRVQVGNSLEAEDWIFLKHHYRVALSNYLAANKIDLENVSHEVMQRARNHALQEAQRNTYRDLSGFANAISKFSKKNAATAILAEGLMPFKKTPINVLKRGVEYSPVGLLKALTYDMAKVVKGDITASEYIDKVCCGLTGTGVVALGMLLKSLGYIVGSSDDDKEKEFDKLQGIQNYSLVIGEHSYTLDWLAPFSLPFFVGVELQNMLESEQGINFRDFSKALSNITEPFFEMSMLQGISDAVNTIRASTSAETFGTVAFNIAKNYFGQAVPTLFGQIARTIDDTQRRSYDDKNMDIPQALQYFAQTQAKKIPGVSKTMQPYVDEWGRKKVTDGIFNRALINMFSPGYYSKIETSEMEEELKRLYDEVGEEDGMSLFPSKAVNKFKLNDDTEKNLTAEEYTKMQEAQGQSAYKLLTGITEGDAYAELDDITRGKLVTNVYALSKAAAKKAVAGDTWTGDKWIETALTLVDGEDFSAAEDYLVYHTLKNATNEKEARSFAFENLDNIPDRVWQAQMSEGATKKYDEYIKDSGVSVEEYIAAKDYKGGLKTINKDTPNEITPKEQMEEYIGGLDMTDKEKRQLYLSMGYSAKTCPW